MANHKPICRKPERYTKLKVLEVLEKIAPCTIMELFKACQKELGCKSYYTIYNKIEELKAEGLVVLEYIPAQQRLQVIKKNICVDRGGITT